MKRKSGMASKAVSTRSGAGAVHRELRATPVDHNPYPVPVVANACDAGSPYVGPLLQAAQKVLQRVDDNDLGLGDSEYLPFIEARRIVHGANDTFVLGHDDPHVVETEGTVPRDFARQLSALGTGMVASPKVRILLDAVARIGEERSRLLGTLRDALDRNDVDAVVRAATLLTGRG